MKQKSVTFQFTLDLRAVALLSVALLLVVLFIAATNVGAIPSLAYDAKNADKVDGLHASKQPKPNRLLALDSNTKFPDSVIPATITRDGEVMSIVKNNDGAGSGLDADLLDGQQGTYYQKWNNLTNMPACFADGVDNTDDTVSWSEISAIVGTGANQVAAGNHNHDAAYLNDDRPETLEAGPAAANLLHVKNTNAANAWSTLVAETNGPGWAIHAVSFHSSHNAGYFEGNVAQGREFNGLVKAAVIVNAAGGCIHSFNPYGTTTCSKTAPGQYSVDFNFQVNDRYALVSAYGEFIAGFVFSGNNTIIVSTFNDDGGHVDGVFMLIVF